MTKTSDLEYELLTLIKQAGLPPPITQYAFLTPTRMWKADGAYPDYQILFECEGGTWSGGRHVNPAGFHNDAIKYNEAAIHGWHLLRFAADLIHSGVAVDQLWRALWGRGWRLPTSSYRPPGWNQRQNTSYATLTQKQMDREILKHEMERQEQ